MAPLEVKSKFNAEFRRFRLKTEEIINFKTLYSMLERIHNLQNIQFIIQYFEQKHGYILPINNDTNCEKALKDTTNPFRILIQNKGESYGELKGYGVTNKVFMRKKGADLVRSVGSEKNKPHDKLISVMDDFHKVSSIIDDETVPESMRRVHLIRKNNKPLGFYIRDGFSIRTTPNGLENVPGVFISRLLPGGLADSTGLLAIKDEIIEVNGIEVFGKSLDQVTDMMIANSSNLIITVKPVDQKTCVRRPNYKNNNPAIKSRVSDLCESSDGQYYPSPVNSHGKSASGSLRSNQAYSSKSPHQYLSSKSSENHNSIEEDPGIIDI